MHLLSQGLEKLEQDRCRLAGHVPSYPHRPYQLLHHRRAELQQAPRSDSRQQHRQRHILALRRFYRRRKSKSGHSNIGASVEQREETGLTYLAEPHETDASVSHTLAENEP